jgi:hypothetical protein
MKKQSFIVILCLYFAACSSFRSNPNQVEYSSDGIEEESSSEQRKDGKCYAKCMIPDKFEIFELLYPVYQGVGQPEGVERKTIVLKPASTKWVKKTTDRNCLSADPNDCLVWCLVEIPAESETLMVVTDTTKVKSFAMRPFSQKTMKSLGGNSEWREIVCEQNESPIFYHNISTSLTARGYLTEKQTVKDDKLKAALTQFQKDKGLPVGQFNVETLKALGVQY